MKNWCPPYTVATMFLNFDVNALGRGNVVWLIALSGKSRPDQSSDHVRSVKDVAHTQEISDALFDLADLVRGKIPYISWRLATITEVAEGYTGTQGGINRRGFQALGMSWFLRPRFVCGRGIVSRGVVKVSECVGSHDKIEVVSAVAWQVRISLKWVSINTRPGPLMRANIPKQPRRAAFWRSVAMLSHKCGQGTVQHI